MKIKDKHFKVLLDYEQISKRVMELAAAINHDYEGKNPLFIAIMNGAFMFAADLMKHVHIPSEITFIKVNSYQATKSTGNVKELIGLQENIFKRNLIIIEDIVDTGNTISHLLEDFNTLGADSIEIVALLHKPEAVKKKVAIKYQGFSIPNKFVVGYGLDYDGYGRNTRDIFELLE
ncbi:hypoxanthine phosphoribosyltransferase [Fulvivirgaceae bacterium BMA12]|uniref:Hypoxanthine phosphoribosyltransferase n=1 Tax=Agaribacillus aureus TaxID=3051825 RepID=A0ABT8LDQ4_9BACT|nr:hypoxanthine phosphoribosyltransferase [Fulvivirgaceae bacterium BMA12]